MDDEARLEKLRWAIHGIQAPFSPPRQARWGYRLARFFAFKVALSK
jgi:hypothetical protein